MSTKPEWKVSDVENARYIGALSVEKPNGEIEEFEILFKNKRLVFGGACNVGFIESGYMETENDGETIGEMLNELSEELEVYYRDGYQYTTRIVCNERM
jgi:hypothetical protein